MSDDDFSSWESFLQYTMNKGLDYGIDGPAVLDRVASTIAHSHITPDFSSATRVADLLLSNLDFVDIRQIPVDMMEFINDTLIGIYPPEPRNKVTSCWMLRALTRAIDACPLDLRLDLFEKVQDGLCIWISDDFQAFTQDEYTFDVSFWDLTVGQLGLTLERAGPLSLPD